MVAVEDWIDPHDPSKAMRHGGAGNDETRKKKKTKDKNSRHRPDHCKGRTQESCASEKSHHGPTNRHQIEKENSKMLAAFPYILPSSSSSSGPLIKAGAKVDE